MLNNIIYSKILVEVISPNHVEEDHQVKIYLCKETNGYAIFVEQFDLGKECFVYYTSCSRNWCIEQAVNLKAEKVIEKFPILDVYLDKLVKEGFSVHKR